MEVSGPGHPVLGFGPSEASGAYALSVWLLCFTWMPLPRSRQGPTKITSRSHQDGCFRPNSMFSFQPDQRISSILASRFLELSFGVHFSHSSTATHILTVTFKVLVLHPITSFALHSLASTAQLCHALPLRHHWLIQFL